MSTNLKGHGSTIDHLSVIGLSYGLKTKVIFILLRTVSSTANQRLSEVVLTERTQTYADNIT